MRVPQATGQQFAGREQERLVEFRCARILLFSHWFGVSLTPAAFTTQSPRL